LNTPARRIGSMQIDLAQVLAVLLRWWYVLVIGLLVGGGVGYLAARDVPAVYRAGVTLQLAGSSGAPTEDPNLIQSQIRTYSEIVRTQPILSAAAARVGLAVPWSQLQTRVAAAPIRDTQLIRVT